VLAFGVLAGSAAGTKLSGWFLPIPFLAWTVLYRDRRGTIALLAGGVIAAFWLSAITPPWWTNPASGIIEFLRSNLSRATTHPMPSLFLGKTYFTPIDSLPWYNTLVWTAIATPLGIVTLALIGVISALRRFHERLEVLAVPNLAFPLIVRALPHTPGHDGVRQFLPTLGCLALAVGLGTVRLISRLGTWGKAFVVVALIEGTVSIALMMPVPLSYFSPICGGLPGAVRLGMEPTYYWDALTDRALDWINTHTADDRTVLFSAVTHRYFYLHSSGRIRPKALFVPLANGIDRYVVENRPLTWYELDRRLIDRFGRWRVIASRQEMPLAWAFSGEDITSVLGDWQWYIVQNRAGLLTGLERQLIGRVGPERVIATKWGVPHVWAFSREDVALVLNSAPG
jgi:hypothetical protein